MIEEPVEIWTSETSRPISTCRLALGQHGLPVLLNAYPTTEIWNFPAAWSLRPLPGQAPGPLLEAWQEIDVMLGRLRATEREAKEETDA